MAATLSFSLCLDPQFHHSHLNPVKAHPFLTSKHPLLSLHKLDRCNFKTTLSFSSSDSASPAKYYSFLDDPYRAGRFLSNDELEKLKALESFVYLQELESGSMWIRVMRLDEMDLTVGLLAESFAESMLMPMGYEALLRFLVKQYLIERRATMPHAVTLVGFYRERGAESEGAELAGTVEVCFDKRGANASPPTPLPPKNSPYICNMTVTKPLRRRGIGWHLLKASEELISQMTSSKEVYLHCRMIDAAPFNMYLKAGYSVVKTDSILILLMFQRRKHLMCKNLPIFNSFSESDLPGSNEELPS